MTGLYQRWQRVGDAALVEASSRAIADALAEGHGRVEVTVLPHRYDHLSPLVAARVTGVRGVEKGSPPGSHVGRTSSTPGGRIGRARASRVTPGPHVASDEGDATNCSSCRDLPERLGRVVGGALCRLDPASLSLRVSAKGRERPPLLVCVPDPDALGGRSRPAAGVTSRRGVWAAA